jgi:hypothetical protein
VVIVYAVTDVACRLVALKIMELLRATNLVHQAFFTQMTARITHSFEFAGILQLLVSILIWQLIPIGVLLKVFLYVKSDLLFHL